MPDPALIEIEQIGPHLVLAGLLRRAPTMHPQAALRPDVVLLRFGSQSRTSWLSVPAYVPAPLTKSRFPVPRPSQVSQRMVRVAHPLGSPQTRSTPLSMPLATLQPIPTAAGSMAPSKRLSARRLFARAMWSRGSILPPVLGTAYALAS
jgi:hypothetical protein